MKKIVFLIITAISVVFGYNNVEIEDVSMCYGNFVCVKMYIKQDMNIHDIDLKTKEKQKNFDLTRDAMFFDGYFVKDRNISQIVKKGSHELVLPYVGKYTGNRDITRASAMEISILELIINNKKIKINKKLYYILEPIHIVDIIRSKKLDKIKIKIQGDDLYFPEPLLYINCGNKYYEEELYKTYNIIRDNLPSKFYFNTPKDNLLECSFGIKNDGEQFRKKWEKKVIFIGTEKY